MNAARYGLDFRYNNKSFSIHIKEIFVFPQDYAAAIIYKQDLIKKYGTVYCIDIGDGTVDLLALKNGMPDKDVMVSRELGMSRLREQIIDDIINDYNMTLDGSIIEDVLTPSREVLAPDEVVSRIRQETTAWAEKICRPASFKGSGFSLCSNNLLWWRFHSSCTLFRGNWNVWCDGVHRRYSCKRSRL